MLVRALDPVQALILVARAHRVRTSPDPRLADDMIAMEELLAAEDPTRTSQLQLELALLQHHLGDHARLQALLDSERPGLRHVATERLAR